MSAIGSINDLIGNGTTYTNTYSGAKQNGFVTSDNAVLNPLWYASMKMKLSTTWKWGTTPYGGTDQNFANCKVFRVWNPGSTKENCYVELTGYEGSNGIAKFVIEDASGTQSFQKYFFDGFKDTLKAGTENLLEFEFKDSDANQSNGYFKCWINGASVCDVSGFKSLVSGGLKRVFILGLQNEWGSSSSNTITLSNLVMAEGKTRATYGGGTPTPTPTPTYLTKDEFKAYMNKVADYIKANL